MSPKISIITISYNSKKTIEQTIQSVLQQDYPNKEYIIVDGCSTDGTMSIIDRYRDRIARVVSEKDRGISDAFNKGIMLATGDIIALINADDILLPDVLSQVAQYYDGETDVYRGNVICWNEANEARFREVASMQFPLFPLHVKVAHQGTFITPKAYEKYGLYDVNIRYPMDLELLRRFYRLGAKMKAMDVDVALWRLGGATSDSLSRKKQDYLRLMQQNGGTTWHAYLYWGYLRLFDVVKRLSNIVFGEDFKRRLKYGKKQTI